MIIIIIYFSLIKAKIVNYMYKKYRGNRGNPLFSIIDQVNILEVMCTFPQILISNSSCLLKSCQLFFRLIQYLLFLKPVFRTLLMKRIRVAKDPPKSWKNFTKITRISYILSKILNFCLTDINIYLINNKANHYLEKRFLKKK